MKFCSKCVLSDSFPGITFDSKDVCNYCLHTPLPDEKTKKEYLKKFEDLLASVKGKHDYDVIMAYSGGKDSTYTMHMLTEKYGMKVLALSFDNGFISEQAKVNITHMTDVCGATSMIVRPPFSLLKKVFSEAAVKEIYSPKTLDRASSVCTTCIGFVKSMVLKTALRFDIPLVAFGWSPGQAPITSAIMHTSPRLQRISQATVRDPLIAYSGAELAKYFLNEKDLEFPKEKWPVNIHPLAFTDYNEEEIIKEIKKFGWTKPSDTDPNSTNCLLNALANYLHRKKFGFHPYAWEVAGIVRSGSMERKEGIEKITQDEDMTMVKYAADKLNINIS